METVPQDVFNMIVTFLCHKDMIELSCTNSKINNLFDSESLWRSLNLRNYPFVTYDHNKSNYEYYVEEYVKRNVTTYIVKIEDGAYSTDDERNDFFESMTPRFRNIQDAIQHLWSTKLEKAGIIKRYHTISPQFERLIKSFLHSSIIEICESDSPRQELMKIPQTLDFLYDEDLSTQDCLDLI